jgi:FKBP-type peptidyl-prolyl cis-trans isomerase
MKTFSQVLGCGLAISVLACESGGGSTRATADTATPSAKPSATVATLATATASVSVAIATAAVPVPSATAIAAPSDVAAAPADAVKSKTGLASKVVTKGKGTEHPSEYDKVKVHYTGWTKEGVMFDSSVTRGEPTEFPLNGVIKGWTEGVQLMVAGEKRRFWIPAKLAYGEKPMPGAPAGDLTFDVELIGFTKAPKPPAVPEDVKAAPASAKKTASGIAYRTIKAGTGKVHPAATSRVSVHYSGWTPDGKMFDSSVVRGEPTSFNLNQVIKGWTEGVQLMVEGEKTRFWIPGPLAYGDTPTANGAPSGMLVFDVELVSIQKQ